MDDMIGALDAAITEPGAGEARPREAEQSFVAALAAHDPDAWRQLFLENHRRVFRYALIRTGSTPDAEDIASNVFASAVAGIRGFRYQGIPVTAWLFRIAHNETVRTLQRRSQKATTTLDHPQAVVRSTPDEIAPHDELADIGAAIGRLKPEHREVLMLRVVEDRSVQEVARLLGKSEAAVKMSQMRALQALRRELER